MEKICSICGSQAAHTLGQKEVCKKCIKEIAEIKKS